MRRLLAGALGALALLAAAPAVSQESPVYVATTAAASMSLPGEAKPHGVQDAWGWPVAPLIQAATQPAGAKYLLPWFQIYEAAEGTGSSNTRVEVRRVCGQARYGANASWGGIATMAPTKGGTTVEDYSAGFDPETPAYRTEATGGSSLKLPSARVWHGWADAYFQIRVGDVAWTYATFQARLVKDDPNGADDRISARYVGSAGMDWYGDSTGANPSGYLGGVAIGRFKRIDSEWRTFVVTTGTAAQLAANPPTC